MSHDRSVVGEAAKFVRLYEEFFDSLEAMRSVILVNGACGALDPVLAESVCAAERVGFGGGSIHDEIF